jgi:hypothetical protein
MSCVSGGSVVAAEAEQRQQGHSSAAMAGSAAAALAMRGRRSQRGGSRALFVGAQRQLSGSNEWGGRAAGHWQQRLQKSDGGSSSTARAVVGTLKDGYVRNVPLPRVPREQRASPQLTAPKDRIQLPGYSRLPVWIPMLPKLGNVLGFQPETTLTFFPRHSHNR